MTAAAEHNIPAVDRADRVVDIEAADTAAEAAAVAVAAADIGADRTAAAEMIGRTARIVRNFEAVENKYFAPEIHFR